MVIGTMTMITGTRRQAQLAQNRRVPNNAALV
jgi:hypothetical protein